MGSVAPGVEVHRVGTRPGGRRSVTTLRGESAAILVAAVSAIVDDDPDTARSDFAALSTEELDAALLVLARTLGLLGEARGAR